jgi:DNA-directed RNA polymerase subunit RPC12/RpoP
MSSISFFCAVCGEALRAHSSFAGRVQECTRCERVVPVPGFPAVPGLSGCTSVYPPDVLSMDLVFLCAACNVRLVVDARWEGRQLECPQCQAPVRVPWWSRRGMAPAKEALPLRRAARRGPALTPEEISFLGADLSPVKL